MASFDQLRRKQDRAFLKLCATSRGLVEHSSSKKKPCSPPCRSDASVANQSARDLSASLGSEPFKVFHLRLRIGLLYCSITVHRPKLHEHRLHEKARRGIERLIADRGIQPGTRVPAERELARELYVSVTTIRTALKALELEGKIERAPGRWTIVR